MRRNEKDKTSVNNNNNDVYTLFLWLKNDASGLKIA